MRLIDADALKMSILSYDGFDINIWQVAEKIDAAPTITDITLFKLLYTLFNIPESEELVYETYDKDGNKITDWYPDWIVRNAQPILRIEIEPPKEPPRTEEI